MELSPACARIFSTVMEAHTGQRIAPERAWRIDIALAPVLRARGWQMLDQLAAELARGGDPALAEAVVEALLNHETSFFRDPAAWGHFEQAALPALAAARAGERRLRLWCAGCATGQEAYSLAMLLAESPLLAGWTLDIVASDVSRAVIAQAERGLYTRMEIQRGLPVRRMIRWFAEEQDGWRATALLRARVRFLHHSLLDAAPAPARFDAIFCRNVLLYFAPPVRARAFARLADAVAADGVLMLGAGETAGGHTARFRPAADARGLFRPVPA